MNRDERPEDPFANIDPAESELTVSPQDQASDVVKGPAADGNGENFAAWLELELEKLEALYQGFSTSYSRRKFFGR